MDLQPTIAQVKAINILNTSGYGNNFIIQVVGFTSVSSPMSVDYQTLVDFANAILATTPNQALNVDPAVIDSLLTASPLPTTNAVS